MLNEEIQLHVADIYNFTGLEGHLWYCAARPIVDSQIECKLRSITEQLPIS